MKEPMKWRWFAPAMIWLAAMGFVALIVSGVYRLEADPAGYVLESKFNRIGGHRFVYVSGAFVIGALGAWAFVIGLNAGLVARSQRDMLLAYLKDQFLLQSAFVFCGGVIAAILQLAEPNSFAPIQAMVIGATWPSVLSQYLSNHAPSERELTPIFQDKAKGDSGQGGPGATRGGGPNPPAGGTLGGRSLRDIRSGSAGPSTVPDQPGPPHDTSSDVANTPPADSGSAPDI